MTSSSTPRYGFSFSVIVAVLAALAIAGSVLAKSASQPTVSEGSMIDVSFLMNTVDTANLPVHHVEYPF
jgi:hypothetical protein